MNKKLRADLMLLLVALIWGATFPLVSASLSFMNAFLLVSFRFGLSALFFLPFIFSVLKKTDKEVLWAGFILGVLNSAVYFLQTFGMRHVDADTAAFIASVGVVFVPFLSAFFRLSKIKVIEILGCLVCVLGLYVLTDAKFDYFNSSEGLILLAALAWAASICYIQKVSPKIKEPKLLAFYQILFVLPFAIVIGGFTYQTPTFNAMVMSTIFYTGILATVVVFLIQVRYQKETTATHAAIIYSLEPVLASIVAIFVNDLPLTRQVVEGGGVILLSILIIELVPRFSVKIGREK